MLVEFYRNIEKLFYQESKLRIELQKRLLMLYEKGIHKNKKKSVN